MSEKIEKKHKGMFFELDYGKDLKIDLKDRKIITIIGENCRTSLADIARLTNTSKDSVRYRIKELIKKDVYRGNIAILNPFILGFSVYSILIKLKAVSSEKEDKIIDFFENHKFIIWVGKTQGVHDFNIIITAKNINHFDKLLKEVQVIFSNSLGDLKILHMTKMYSCNTIPPEFQSQAVVKTKKEKNDSSFSAILKNPYCSNEEEKTTLNLKEILILKEISNNSNLSFQEVFERTKIKPDTVKNTIRDLIKKNMILAFRASINVSFLRYHGYITYFKLHPATNDAKRKEFEKYFVYSPTTSFGTVASGSCYDVMIYTFAQNPFDYNKMINEIKIRFPDIIEEFNSDLILMDYKFTFFPEGLLSPIKELIVRLGTKFDKLFNKNILN